MEPSEIVRQCEDPPVRSVNDFEAAEVTRDEEDRFLEGEWEKYPSSSDDEKEGDEGVSEEGDAGRGECEGDTLSAFRGRGVNALMGA